MHVTPKTTPLLPIHPCTHPLLSSNLTHTPKSTAPGAAVPLVPLPHTFPAFSESRARPRLPPQHLRQAERLQCRGRLAAGQQIANCIRRQRAQAPRRPPQRPHSPPAAPPPVDDHLQCTDGAGKLCRCCCCSPDCTRASMLSVRCTGAPATPLPLGTACCRSPCCCTGAVPPSTGSTSAAATLPAREGRGGAGEPLPGHGKAPPPSARHFSPRTSGLGHLPPLAPAPSPSVLAPPPTLPNRCTIS